MQVPDILSRGAKRGFAALACGGLVAGAGCGGEPPVPNILLITIDTLRADHLSGYGYPRPTTPGLDALAREGVRFEVAYAPAATTAPSHASLFTSLYPPSHRVLQNGRRLAPGYETLAEILARNGFDTAGIVSSYVLSERFGYGQGFSTWDENFEDAEVEVGEIAWEGEVIEGKFHGRADDTTRRALTWLEKRRDDERPFLLFVHYYDPHDPYAPPPEDADRFVAGATRPLDRIVARYDGEIVFTDREIARLLEGLSDMGLAHDTIVVVTGDHGEGLMQHGHMAHGVHVYEEAIRVPLLMRWPAGLVAGESFETPVEILDVAPTLLALLGIEAEGRGFEGRSLAAVLRGEAEAVPAKPLFFYRRPYEPGRVERSWAHGEKFAVRKGRWKYILGPEEATEELFDLERDPGEEVNRREEQPIVTGELRALVESWRTRVTRPDPDLPSLTEPERRRLEALGYAQ